MSHHQSVSELFSTNVITCIFERWIPARWLFHVVPNNPPDLTQWGWQEHTPFAVTAHGLIVHFYTWPGSMSMNTTFSVSWGQTATLFQDCRCKILGSERMRWLMLSNFCSRSRVKTCQWVIGHKRCETKNDNCKYMQKLSQIHWHRGIIYSIYIYIYLLILYIIIIYLLYICLFVYLFICLFTVFISLSIYVYTTRRGLDVDSLWWPYIECLVVYCVCVVHATWPQAEQRRRGTLSKARG